MQENHRLLLKVVHDLDLENPTLGGAIPVTIMVAPKLQGVFGVGELGTAIKTLDQGGYLKIVGNNALGQVRITESGKSELT